ncbi:MAG: hypothetical protein AAFV72_24320 [Cyanobacteria bacterium J06635_1]
MFVAGLSFALGPVARAEVPDIYPTWRVLGIDTEQCLARANTALIALDIEMTEITSTSISGHNQAARAMFICVADDPTVTDEATTTVMLVVAGEDETSAIALRDALKEVF